MSLQVWLPLNGSNINNGLSTLTFAGSPNSWSTAGKIGTCSLFNGNTGNVIYNNSTDFNYTKNFTVCLWIKPNYTGSSTQYAFTVGRADYGGYGYGLQVLSATSLNFWFGNGSYSFTCDSTTWHHVAMTVDENSLSSVYLDGSLVGTRTPSSLPTYSDGNGVGIGCFHYSGNIYPCYSYINDFRIYDECLSKKGIKEISKGLILHYPLNQAERSKNYFTNGSAEYTGTFPSSSYTDYISRSNIVTVSPSEVWTLSYDAKASASNIPLVNHLYNNTSSIVQVSSSINSQGYSSTSSDGYTLFSLTTEYKHYWVTWTFNSGTAANKHLLFRLNSTANSGKTVTVKNIKLEKCSVPTNYCPSSSDSINWSNSIEYDTSGFGYDGAVNSSYSPTLSNDSPRNGYCYNFNGSQYLYCVNKSWMVNGIEGQTVSIWGYMTDWSSYNAPMFSSTEDGGFNCEPSSTGIIRFQVCVFTNSAKSSSSYTSYVADTTYSLTSLAAGWHFFTFVYTTSYLKIYIDGTEVKSTSYTSYGINHTAVYSSKYLFLGTEANGTSASSTKLTCKLSDFRVYNTALSTSDIKELYNTPISVTNNGTILTHGEFVEE